MKAFFRAKIVGGALLVALGALLAGTATAPAAAAPGKAPGRADAAQVGRVPAGAKLDSAALARHIDQVIGRRAAAEKVTLSPRADDAEFLRRAYLDITGVIPTAEKAAAFLDSKEPDKRAKLIDELLAGKDYGKHQADIWQGLMLPRSSDNLFARRFYPNIQKWLEDSFNDNKPWDQMVREVLTFQGPVDKTGPGPYYLANGPTVDKVTDSVTKLFLGVQLQCAQCHNHPFTDWKQTEYWGMAAFFTKTGPSGGNPKALAKKGGTINIAEGPRGFGGRRRLPESAKIVPPKFLQGEQPKVKADDPLRPVLADWLTSPKNPFFARAMVNRTWGQLFGRGFVNPVDDMHEGNPASHPELLADLAQQFAAHGFDVKYLIRAICNSEAYQRTSKPAGNNGDAAPELFARMPVKVLTPGQLFDSLSLALGGRNGDRPIAPRGAGGRFGPVTQRQVFVNFFQVEEGADPTEYQAGIPQVLRLMNAPAFNNAASVGLILKDTKDWKVATEKLYLSTLSRRPTEAELARVGAHVRKNKDEPRQAFADVLWALVNCSEFAVNH
jgi:hypothetical protein